VTGLLAADGEAALNWVDVGALIVLAVFFLRGLSRGLLLQVLGLGLLAGGLALALALSARFGAWIRAEVWGALTDRVARATAFVVLFIGSVGLSSMLLRLLGESSSTLRGGRVNRVLGGVLGGLKGALLVMAFVLGAANLLSRGGDEPAGFLREVGRSRAGAATRWTAERVLAVLPEEVAGKLARYAGRLP
jgi:uncharacterized membrane protein required for colicin V production